MMRSDFFSLMKGLLEHYRVISLITLPIVFVLLRLQTPRHSKPGYPPSLKERIPHISNGLLLATNRGAFLQKLRLALQESPIVQYFIGPLRVCGITGTENVFALFRGSYTSQPWVLHIMTHSCGYSSSDMAKFADGGMWHALHSMYNDALISTLAVKAFAADFECEFTQRLTRQEKGKWTEVSMLSFLRENIVIAATGCVMGHSVMDTNPGFLQAFAEYEKYFEALAFGVLPNFLNRKANCARDRFRGMFVRWFQQIGEYSSLDDPQGGAFVSPISRGFAEWARKFDLSMTTIGAAYASLLIGLHANTVPVIAWIMIELVKDRGLLEAVRREIDDVGVVDKSTGHIDHNKLRSLPLLQSVYTEVLRLRVCALITRTSTEQTTIAGYPLPVGLVLQAPAAAAHLNEQVWGTRDHPASEFWAARHLVKGKYSLSGRKGYFFPFGGGQHMCMGRNFAKQEVFLATALMLTKFDMEFVAWVKHDGSTVEGPPCNDADYPNTVTKPPDREMKIRWRRTQ